ncbi:MAG: pseudaminic acid cytidylyltransferase [Deltaproteobacteria bacterium]|nr:pseudaminic acid cytidylyltransferase [Deltaproteobacteria bacterium]
MSSSKQNIATDGMCIAIIPARGGSKRIPGKNARLMNGKPLIAWAIEACLETALFSHILVSTDCPQIARIAEAHGAEVPFLRPAELADDFTPTRPVTNHALEWAVANWGKIDCYCQLYANPFIQPGILLQAKQLLTGSDADVVMGVTEYAHPILRALAINEQGKVCPAFPEYKSSRTQDLPVFYHDAAQFYWNRHHRKAVDAPLSTIPVIIPRHFAVDIDNEDDWILAEQMQLLFLQKTGRSCQHNL